MKKIIIDGAKIATKDELHDTLAAAFGFPEWYGRNLDALYDCLTTYPADCETGCEADCETGCDAGDGDGVGVIVENFNELDEAIPIYARLTVRVIRRACRENPRLTCEVDLDEDEDEE